MRTNKRVGVTHTNLTGSESTVENWGVIETVNGCVHARFRGFLSTLLCAKEHLCVYGSRRKLRILTTKDTCMSGKHEQNERSKHTQTHIHIHKRYHPETERDTCKPKQNMRSPFLGGMLDANVHLQCLLALEAPLSIPLPVGASCSPAHQPQISLRSAPIRAHFVFRSVLRQGIVAASLGARESLARHTLAQVHACTCRHVTRRWTRHHIAGLQDVGLHTHTHTSFTQQGRPWLACTVNARTSKL